MLLRVPCKLAASGSHVGCMEAEFGDARSAKHDILIPRCLLISGIVLAAIYKPPGCSGDEDRTLDRDRREGRPLGGFHTLEEWPAMMIQFTVFAPAVIAIYAATGAWVFSCDPISKTLDVVRGGLLYGWMGVLFVCMQVLALQRHGSVLF